MEEKEISFNKLRCKELKKVRKEMCERLGIEYKEEECTFENECTGTCSNCMEEESNLNVAIKEKLEEDNKKANTNGLTIGCLVASACVGLELITINKATIKNNEQEQKEILGKMGK